LPFQGLTVYTFLSMLPNNPSSASVIEVQAVHKSFRNIQAVRGIDLIVHEGEFVALLGPNGAGKTTLVEMIEGIQVPDAGEIRVLGKYWKGHAEELHPHIGIALQETRLIDKLTVTETLSLFASFYELGKKRVAETLSLISLTEKKDSFVLHLSGGQRQRLALGIALLNRPRILILDEPTTGFDPNARQEVWSILLNLKKEGKTALVLTTHYMEEAETLCDRIYILNQGTILKQGSLDDLLGEERTKTLDDLFREWTGRHLHE